MSQAKPFCSICDIPLTIKDKEQQIWECDSCNAVYHAASEIMKYEDKVTFAAEDDMPELAGVSTAGPGLLTTDDEADPPLIDQLYKKERHAPNRGEGAETWD